MTPADIRRASLRQLITTRFNGVARQCALAAGKPEGQINDMLATPARKAFGEKVARQIEQSLDLPAFYLDQRHLTDYPTRAAEDPATPIYNFAERRGAHHPIIKQVVDLMQAMDDAGKFRVLERAIVIAESHPSGKSIKQK